MEWLLWGILVNSHAFKDEFCLDDESLELAIQMLKYCRFCGWSGFFGRHALRMLLCVAFAVALQVVGT
jgi:hypothetical protein